MNKLYQRISMIRERTLHIYSLSLIDGIELEMENKNLGCNDFTLKMPFNTNLGLRNIIIETRYYTPFGVEKMESIVMLDYNKGKETLFHFTVSKEKIIRIFIDKNYLLTPNQIDLALLELENYLDKYYKRVAEINFQRDKRYDEIAKYFS